MNALNNERPPTLVEIRIDTIISSAGSGVWTAFVNTATAREEILGIETLSSPHRAELAAATASLATLSRRTAVELHTDSEYLIQGATTWFPKWKTFGWLSDTNNRMRNQLLWEQLYAVAARHDIHWHGPSKGPDRAYANGRPLHEIYGRTSGEGADVGYLHSGDLSPWHGSLGDYRPFTNDEMRAELTCSYVSVDIAEEVLSPKQKQERENVIARVAQHYRPETRRKRIGVIDHLISIRDASVA